MIQQVEREAGDPTPICEHGVRVDTACRDCDSAVVVEKKCGRGHFFRTTKLAEEHYKGSFPMPCPVCAQLGLRELGVGQ